MLLKEAKKKVVDNLETLEAALDIAVNQGLMDENASYYNQMATLADDAEIAESWNELAEVIYRAKILEADLDTWISLKGETTIGLPWPTEP